jgi:Flp pilus assembly CpaF family ATPase
MLATLHAHSPTDALDALAATALFGNHQLPPETVRATFARNIDVVVHLDSEDVELRGDDHRHLRRQVMEIAAVSPLQGGETRFTTIAVFTREDIGAPLLPTGHPCRPGSKKAVDQGAGQLRDHVAGCA